MGGLGFGEVASAITTYTVTRMVREGHGINQAIEVAHRNIKEYAETDGLGTNMGTTIVLLLSHGSLYNVFWVGDSRAYLHDKNGLNQITVDHSLVQSLIDQGELTREEAESDPRKNAVTRALGVQELETVRADSISERWKPGQKILLCSDRLTDCVSDEDIAAIMADDAEDQELVDRLIEAALAGGGKDNVTVIVVSAPKTAKAVESDTHVPTGDDTHVPSDDTYVPSPDDTQERAQLNSPLHLGLSIDAQEEQINEEEPKEPLAEVVELPVTEEPTAVRYPASNALVAAIFFLLVAGYLVGTSPEQANPEKSIPENFLVEDLTPAEPLVRDFPEFDFPTDGEVLQLGLFARLEGAETHQTELTGLGLEPHIEKRVSSNSVQYAVVLGPLDEQDHQVALRTLDRNNLPYFHRQNLLHGNQRSEI